MVIKAFRSGIAQALEFFWVFSAKKIDITAQILMSGTDCFGSFSNAVTSIAAAQSREWAITGFMDTSLWQWNSKSVGF